jgi:hypothetical protein
MTDCEKKMQKVAKSNLSFRLEGFFLDFHEFSGYLLLMNAILLV